MITGKLYDWLKWIAQVVLPAIGTLYVALAGLWGLPAAEAIAGTILAVDTFLGVLLGISQVSYQKKVSEGVMYIPADNDPQKYHMVVDDPTTLGDMKEVHFRVAKPRETGVVPDDHEALRIHR